MTSAGAKGSTEADLRAAFEDRDDHHVGDADAADEEGHGAETEEQAVVDPLAATSAFKMSDGKVTATTEGSAGLTVADRTAATALTWLGALRRYSPVG